MGLCAANFSRLRARSGGQSDVAASQPTDVGRLVQPFVSIRALTWSIMAARIQFDSATIDRSPGRSVRMNNDDPEKPAFASIWSYRRFARHVRHRRRYAWDNQAKAFIGSSRLSSQR